MAVHQITKQLFCRQNPKFLLCNRLRDYPSTLLCHKSKTFSALYPRTLQSGVTERFIRPLNQVENAFRCSAAFHASATNLQFSQKYPNLSQMLSDTKHIKSTPIQPLVLGLSGVLPLLGPPLYFLSGDVYDPQIAYAQLAYGATILSFLGGVRWGFALPESSPVSLSWKNLCHGITVSLGAWISLLFPTPVGIVAVGSGLAAAAYYDNILPGYPLWFKALRTTLTAAVLFSLLLTLVCYLLLEHETETKKE